MPLQVKPATDAPSDDKVDVSVRKNIKLYKCSDEDGGTLKITEVSSFNSWVTSILCNALAFLFSSHTIRLPQVKTGPLLQSDLKPEDSFIVDNGNAGIWVWVGKKASQQERTEAMRNAQGFIKKKSKWGTVKIEFLKHLTSRAST